MKRGWLTGGSILLAALIAASPAMGEGWYGAFKPFFYASDLSHFGKNPLPARSAGPLTEGAMSAVNNPSDAVSIAGAELTLGRRLDESSSAELTLTKLRSGAASLPSLIGSSKSLPTLFNGNFITAIVMDGFRRSLPESMEYDTEFISAELNYRRQAAALWSFMGGFRYMYLGEELDQSAPGNHVLQPNRLYGVDSESHFIGAQVGADFAASLRENLSISGEIKLAGFVNVVETTTLLFDNEGNTFSYKDADTRIATLVEGNFSMDWLIGPNMSLSAGYMAVFMGKISDGASIAHDRTAAGFKYNDTDNVLFHGPVLKFQFIW